MLKATMTPTTMGAICLSPSDLARVHVGMKHSNAAAASKEAGQLFGLS